MKISKLNYRYNFLYPDENIDLHIWGKNPVPMHSHNFYEFILVQQGNILQNLNNKLTCLRPYSLFLVYPEDAHSLTFDKDKPSSHINLAIRPEFFNKSIDFLSLDLYHKISNRHNQLVQLSKSEFEQVSFWVKQINMTDNGDKQKKLSLLVSFYFFVLSLFSYHLDSRPSTVPAWFNEVINKIQSPDFIDKSAKDIYKISPYSQAMLIKFFKTHLNCTPTEYLTNIKINYACNLLKNTDYSVLYIANEIGFSSLSHFNHLFKKIKGVTPGEYRLM